MKTFVDTEEDLLTQISSYVTRKKTFVSREEHLHLILLLLLLLFLLLLLLLLKTHLLLHFGQICL